MAKLVNYWKRQGIPHKGWTLVDVIDFGTDYGICMMCGKENIRYIHILEHAEVLEQFMVGCICAEKMTDDYFYPKKRERELRNRARRRINWIKKEWKRNLSGNYYLNIGERYLLIYLDNKTNKYKVKINEIFGKKTFSILEEAKVAAFDGIEYLKDKGKL